MQRAVLAAAEHHAEAPHLDALARQALAHAMAERHADAAVLFERLHRQQPDEPAHALNLGNARLACADVDGALQAFEAAERLGGDGVALWLGQGLAWLAARRFQEAGRCLGRAYRAQPGASDVALAWAQYLVEMERFDDARRCLARIDIAAVSPMQRRGVAWLHAQAGDEHLALQLFAACLADDPGDDVTRLQYALLLERMNRVDEAGEQLAAVRHPSAQPALYALCRGRWLRRRGDARGALAHVRSALEHAGGDEMAAQLHFEAARLHDLDRDEDAAMSSLQQAHASAKRAFHVRHPEAEHADPLAWLAQRLAAPAPAHWHAPIEDGHPPDPVFLVGFPRSGTTLLQQLLRMHPALQVAEEVPVLEDVIAALYGDARDGDLGARLEALAPAQRTALRGRYWSAMAAHAPDPYRRLVDKYPLSLTRIGHIARLFPRAHTLCLLRHPCDVVLSCHMQAFGLNGGALAFSSLASTAEAYARVMTYWEEQRVLAGCAVHVLRYEDLVVAPGPTLREIHAFLGILPHGGGIEEFHRQAHERETRIRTPSYAQVARPLNTDALYRWRRYRRHFAGEPMARLAPWIERYGYRE
ncbi:sulfotransferase family protein [Pseudoxanthomonas sp. 3HH-4]|uniref:tetratricopeptide repeat-containing sulfotransferase family protein n=1 Tax=Pseudoxanthomonas sp. 3HH-4 TaxID=1690214 RepID=UPI00116E25B8|nr:sulfotransferase [Pseudoxanthomonas sp. 3HH-4]TQM06935.1 sulfotransferase family protein [Pseudoxanthomonas sp. 3HH-4]